MGLGGSRFAVLKPLCALGLGVVLAGGGCSNVIGLDDYEEVDDVDGRGGRANTDPPATGGRPPASGGTAPMPTGGAGPSGASCELPNASANCRQCVETSCAAECGRCRGDPACVAVLGCLRDCAGDSECLASCADEHPDGVAPFLELYADYSCGFTTCKLACTGRLGAIGDACDANAHCQGAFCSGPDGWCTGLCDTSLDCPANSQCVVNGLGTTTCFMGCQSDDDCLLYPGTVCQMVEAVDGQVRVCAVP